MPEMNGFAATEYIRNTINSEIPIIALTADVTTVDLAKCKEAGINDYVSKPVDERLLYGKIIDLLKKPTPIENNTKKKVNPAKGKDNCFDLTYLKEHTKANHLLIMQMIELYLEQTPPLNSQMKQNMFTKDWPSLSEAVHKLIPSFTIMGIHQDAENKARKIQEYASKEQHLDEIQELVLQLNSICSQACDELKEEYNFLKLTNQ
jgi:CheY-like chemotaxis protein